MEGKTKRRQKRLSVGAGWVRLAVFARRLIKGALQRMAVGWRGVLRALPPREAVIVVLAGGVAFGLGATLGRVTAPDSEPLGQGYVTIEEVNSMHADPAGADSAGTGALPGTGRVGSGIVSSSDVGADPGSGADNGGSSTPPTGSGPAPAPREVAGGDDEAEGEGAGVVGPVPIMGTTAASMPSASPTESPGQNAGEHAAFGKGVGGSVDPSGGSHEETGPERVEPSSTDAAAPRTVAARPAAPGSPGASSQVTPAGPSVQAPKQRPAQAPSQEKRQEKMLVPVQGDVISEFGWRKHPVFADWRYHTGIDIAVPEGVTVRAALSGEVAEVANDRQLGLYVVIEHEGGLRTKYAHLASSPVSPGDAVTQGQPIGTSGTSGVTSGCYVHFEVVRNGKAQDPMEFL